MRFGKQLTLAIAAGFATLALSFGEARADSATTLVEAGKPGSGIKEITHVFSKAGLLGKRLETSRSTLYDDGHSVRETFNRDGTLGESYTDIPKNGHWIREVYRPLRHRMLWTRTHNMIANQTTTEYYGLNGRLKLIRAVYDKGDMDVLFDDSTASYVQHWESGIAGYVLTSVKVTPLRSAAYSKYVLLGRTVTSVEEYATDGSLHQIRHLRNGRVDKVEHWNKGILQKTTNGNMTKERVPSWTFIEIGGLDDPSVPK